MIEVNELSEMEPELLVKALKVVDYEWLVKALKVVDYEWLLTAIGRKATEQRDAFGHSKEGREISVFLTELEKLTAWTHYHGFDNYAWKLRNKDGKTSDDEG